MKTKLAIFDLDGTILNTLDDLADSLNHVLDGHGFPQRTLEEVRCFVGNGIHKLIERAVPKGASPTQIETVYQSFTAYYGEHCKDKTQPYDGIPGVLRELKARGLKTAVVSNKADFAVQELIVRYFDGLFDAAAGEKAGVRRKPAPDSVNAVLHQLNIAPENAVYIGDSDVDIETAENAGMPCLSVTWGYRDTAFLKDHGAQILLSEPAELLSCIQ